MGFTENDHTFAVCAYGESAYLEQCIRFLMRQSVSSRIILCAAKENDYIRGIAEKKGIPLLVRGGTPGIAADWNFAYRLAGTPLVTLAHQDDLYGPHYLERVLQAVNRAERPIIAFTDYIEISNGKKISSRNGRNLKIKEIILTPFKFRALAKSRFVRRRILSFGSPICCPSVTYVRENAGEDIFEKGLQVALDWNAWEKLSRRPGSFCYVPAELCAHRLHEESATSKAISAHVREREDLLMFEKFWPVPVAKMLNSVYRKAQAENSIGKRK